MAGRRVYNGSLNSVEGVVNAEVAGPRGAPRCGLRGESRPLAQRVADHQAQRRAIAEGGGEKAAARQRKNGKLLARERVAALIDDGTEFLELGSFAAWEIYEEWGGAPSAGVVTGLGRVSGRECVIVANDATVKAGAWFPLTCKKILRAQDFSLENRLPIIYLVDSAGVFLPMQDEIFPDREHFGRVFYNNARLSAEGIYQISAIMGSCVAGGAYLPIMSDEALIVEGTGTIFLAGSHLVQAAIGEKMDNQELGGAEVQVDISGVVDDRFPDDESAIATSGRGSANWPGRPWRLSTGSRSDRPWPIPKRSSDSCRSIGRGPTAPTICSAGFSTAPSSPSTRRPMAGP